MEFWAASAAALATWIVPVTTPGGKPVTAVPGLRPRSPVTIVGPVLVTVEAPTTAKLDAPPRGGRTARALTLWPLPSAAGARGPVGVRCDDGEPQPEIATARAAIRDGIPRRRTGLMADLQSRAVGTRID